MLKAVDSAYPPSKVQIAQAKAAGVSAWLGYFPGVNILNGWNDSNFEDVLNGGLQTGAYCSGWADAASVKAHAAALGIIVLLDDESGIRSLAAGYPSANRQRARTMLHGGQARPVLEYVNGLWRISAWVQPWLDISGGYLYGNQPVFAGARAAGYVFAAYLGYDPGLSWPNYYPRPSDGHPCGWQVMGTHVEFGIGVDSSNLDDNFFAALHGGGGGQLTGGIREVIYYLDTDNNAIYAVYFDARLNRLAKYHVSAAEWSLLSLAGVQPTHVTSGPLQGVPDGSGYTPSGGSVVDLSPVLTAVAAVKTDTAELLVDVAAVKADTGPTLVKVNKDLA